MRKTVKEKDLTKGMLVYESEDDQMLLKFIHFDEAETYFEILTGESLYHLNEEGYAGFSQEPEREYFLASEPDLYYYALTGQ